MLTKINERELQKINSIINLIDGSKDRYNISIIPNVLGDDVYVLIYDSSYSKLIYYNIFHTTNENHVETINILRNNFVDNGTIFSKLTTLPKKEKITYNCQELFKRNLYMFIHITGQQEELEAIKVHKNVLQSNSIISNQPKIKTIQQEKVVG